MNLTKSKKQSVLLENTFKKKKNVFIFKVILTKMYKKVVMI